MMARPAGPTGRCGASHVFLLLLEAFQSKDVAEFDCRGRRWTLHLGQWLEVADKMKDGMG